MGKLHSSCIIPQADYNCKSAAREARTEDGGRRTEEKLIAESLRSLESRRGNADEGRRTEDGAKRHCGDAEIRRGPERKDGEGGERASIRDERSNIGALRISVSDRGYVKRPSIGASPRVGERSGERSAS